MSGWTIAGLTALALFGPAVWKRYYEAHVIKHDVRETALTEAAHGAAMIALALLAVLRLGRMLPAWFPLVALAVAVWGIFRLVRGAKFSVGWRDPNLIAGAMAKAGVGVAIYALVWNPPAWVPLDVRAVIGVLLVISTPYGAGAMAAVAVWCAVTGLTKLVLVLRGFPAMPWIDPDMPHGAAGFSSPDDPGFKL
jgi:hypothetical protein